MRTNAYIIRKLKEACTGVKPFPIQHATFNEALYTNEGSYGTSFLLYLYSLRKLPAYKIGQDIKSATNAESVILNDISIIHQSISAVANKPRTVPSRIYSDLSKYRPFTLCDTGFRIPYKDGIIPFKISMVEIEHVDLSIQVDLKSRTRLIEPSVDNSKVEKLSESWEEFLDSINIKKEMY